MKLRILAIAAIAFALGAAASYFAVRHPSGVQEAATETQARLWTCSMHPQVLQEEPGNCPICGMKLVPVKSGETAPEHTAHEAAAGPSVHVSKQFLQNFAVTTVNAEKGAVPIDLRTIGSLRFNEKTIVSVNTKFEGWIERAAVNYVGEPVEKGQLLFEIYSPQLVTAQKEYLASLDYLERLSATAKPDAVQRAASLVEAAKERLRWWDISDEQIEGFRHAKAVTRTVKIFAPASGMVIEKIGDALEGMKLTPGMAVFKIADLSTIWADIEIYEHQMQFARIGQTANITADAFPGRLWSGRIIYLDPMVNQQTRTLRASVEIANSGGRLRPAMFVNVELRAPSPANVVRVPREAVLHSGEQSIVIVQREPGHFQPREVELGAAGGGYQEIRAGIEAGEQVVTSSQFLIDSESNLREAIGKMLAATEEPAPGAAAPPAHQH